MPYNTRSKPVSYPLEQPNLTHLLRGLKQMQKDKPVYHGPLGAHGWWSEVIKRTAIGAGADPHGMRPSRLHTENAWA